MIDRIMNLNWRKRQFICVGLYCGASFATGAIGATLFWFWVMEHAIGGVR